MRYKILIVDDQPGQRWQMKRQLEEDYDIETAESRKDAINKLARYEGIYRQDRGVTDRYALPALVIVDQNLSDYNAESDGTDVTPSAEGLALIDYIKQSVCEWTQVVICTAYFRSASNLGFEASEIGADGYLDKGPDDSELLDLREQADRFVRRYTELIGAHNRRQKLS